MATKMSGTFPNQNYCRNPWNRPPPDAALLPTRPAPPPAGERRSAPPPPGERSFAPPPPPRAKLRAAATGAEKIRAASLLPAADAEVELRASVFVDLHRPRRHLHQLPRHDFLRQRPRPATLDPLHLLLRPRPASTTRFISFAVLDLQRRVSLPRAWQPSTVEFLSSIGLQDNHFSSIHSSRRGRFSQGLMNLLAQEAPKCMKDRTVGSYLNKTIAIDTNIWMYEFLKAKKILENDAGEQTNHIQGLLQRTAKIFESQIKPIYIFDGPPPQMKIEVIAQRNLKRKNAEEELAYRTGLPPPPPPPDTSVHATTPWKKQKVSGVVLTRQARPLVTHRKRKCQDDDDDDEDEHIKALARESIKPGSRDYHRCQKLFELLGVPYVEAPSEGEAQCVQLCKEHKAHAVVSQDSDCIPFGAPLMLRDFTCEEKKPVKEFNSTKLLHELKLSSHDEFLDFCILCGCDYLATMEGMYPKLALNLIREHRSIENILQANRPEIHKDWPSHKVQQVRDLFNNPDVKQNVTLNWRKHDEEGLVKFMVDENTFDKERMEKIIFRINRVKNSTFKQSQISFFNPKQRVEGFLRDDISTSAQGQGHGQQQERRAGSGEQGQGSTSVHTGSGTTEGTQ